ncbi:MAG TPA: hypothetical protein VJT74_15885 [Pyrinomonadaceae bacterium]|nr:hypothetical protein [Pyrinomonadaceae bacterium]
MYGLTTIKGLMRRGWLAAFAVAALLSLAAPPARAQAFDPTFRGGIFVGAARGQTIRLRFAATNNQGKLLVGVDDGIFRAGTGTVPHVKVFRGTDGSLLRSYELSSLTAGLHMIDVNRDELLEAGDPVTGRLLLWIEVVLVPEPGVTLLTPTFEVVNTYTGQTTVQGELVKVRTGTLVLANANTYR